MPDSTESFSINELSNRLGHARGSLTRWLLDVEPCGTRNGFPVYALADVECAVRASMQRHRTGTTGRERLVAAQAEKIEYQIAVLKRQFVPVEDVERDVAAMIGQARRILESGPTSLAPQVVGVPIVEAEQLIRDWVQHSLQQLHTDPLGQAQQQTVTEHPHG